MRKFHLIFILLLLCGVSQQILACSCKRVTYEEKIDQAAWIVIAKVNKLELSDQVDDILGSIIEVGIEPIELIKGNELPINKLATTTSTCGFDYQIAKTYLIFADQDGQTNICTGSMPVVFKEGFAFEKGFTKLFQNIKAYLNGEVQVIDTFYNPISKRTINGPVKEFQSTCHHSGKTSDSE